MKLTFHLVVEERPDGSTLVEVLGAADLHAFEESRAAAFDALRSRISDQVEWREAKYWLRLRPPGPLELRVKELEVLVSSEADAIMLPARIAVLVAVLPGTGDSRVLVTAYRVPGFQWVLRPEEVDTAVPAALSEHLSGWKPKKILKACVHGEVALESLPWPEENGGDEFTPAEATGAVPDSQSDGGGSDGDVLGLCGVNFTQRAKEGRLEGADRREALLQRIFTVLSGESRNSVMLVGPPDTGKTALVHEVARRLVAGTVPEALRERQLWSVTANNLIAGMAYYGEWQGRAQKLVRQLRDGRQVLFMGDPEEILSAGRYRGSDNNLGRYLRAYMESGDVVLICECSAEAYAAQLHREPSFMNAFYRIDVPETEPADTEAILQGVARRFEGQHSLRVESEALTAACHLTRRFLPYRAFPGKAVRLLQDTVRDLVTQGAAETQVLGRAEVVTSFTRATGLPAFVLSDEIPMRHATVHTHFQERLLGQPEAVSAMVDVVTVLKAGLNDPNKPLGSFFFVGPTGVGKTEMAKVLAEFLFGSRDRMLRFDMSEYATADALPRLIGSAWRSDDEGELTRRVREQPFCVVLLDELEKAHPDVFDALLGVLGEGRLTDAGGRSTDFRNAIIIMTSNLGAGRRNTQPVGFPQATSAPVEADARLAEHFVKAAEAFFRPEFFNRIDRIVAFRSLSPEAVRLITRREVGKLLMREGIVRRNLLVEVDEAVIGSLAERGFHPHYGARPLQRVIERTVILPLARLLVDEGADHRHLVHFTLREGEIQPHRVLLETGDEPAPVEPAAPDRRLEADVAGVARVLARVRQDLELAEAGELVQGLREEASALLAQTREPTFWDTPEIARGVLQRIYRLERVVKRLETLLERALRLDERTQHLRRQRDRRSLPEVAAQVERLETEVSFLQAEIAGLPDAESGDTVLLCVAPLSPDAEAWAGQLREMYTAWAERKAYGWILVPQRAVTDGASAEVSRLSPPHGLFIQGSGVVQFLRAEAGLHKLNAGSAEERRRLLARVSVYSAPEFPDPQRPEEITRLAARLLTEAATEQDSEVVRIYQDGRHRYVRDPRTGTRLTHVEAVLKEGRIDPFLLAHLQQAAAR